MDIKNIVVIKKDEKRQSYQFSKIVNAANSAAVRSIYRNLNDKEIEVLQRFVEEHIEMAGEEMVSVNTLHNYVEGGLDYINPKIAASYRSYRDNMGKFKSMMSRIQLEANTVYYGDSDDSDPDASAKSNSNRDDQLVSTKRCMVFDKLNTELYEEFFLTDREMEAQRDGYIYIHDRNARRDTMNCCLFDVATVLKDGFECGGIWYNEPTGLPSAMDVIGDIGLMSAAQQYGGFTMPQIDETLAPYAEKSYNAYLQDYLEVTDDVAKAERKAWNRVCRDAEQGFQGWEYKFNTVASSRGDYPFTTLTFGLARDRFGKMLAKACLKVRGAGEGKKENKKPVLFPKLVFLYDENLHGPGKELEDVFEAGIACSQKSMYPDWLSMTGEGYIASMYKQYGKVISPMGCRAFLSPWWKKGGRFKADETDEPIFIGRFNIGAISLNLPMILAKAKEESKNFYDVLDYYLELIRGLHLRTYAYLGEMKAASNPLAYCEGGFYGGHLKLTDKIAPLLESATASFGITALNELQQLYNGKSLVEDGQFALEVMEFINKRVNQFKDEDGHLYAIYGTPAESLCSRQVKQFRKKYGIIKNVSDRPYVSNSFHCHVTEDINPIQKQNLEGRFWELCNGGKIQYVRYPIDYNVDAIKTLIRRAMALGFYEGVNMSLAYCDDCGHQELEMDTCPCCGSRNLTKIDRMNGYLSFSRIHGETRLNAGKMAEIAERKSM